MRKELASTFEIAKQTGKYIFNLAVRIVDPHTVAEDLFGPDCRFLVIGQGEVADVHIIPHRDMGTYPGGVAVKLVRKNSFREVKDIFYSLDDRGESLWHIAETPFLGTKWEIRDTSWKDLTPYREQIAAVRVLPRNVRSTLLRALNAY